MHGNTYKTSVIHFLPKISLFIKYPVSNSETLVFNIKL